MKRNVKLELLALIINGFVQMKNLTTHLNWKIVSPFHIIGQLYVWLREFLGENCFNFVLQINHPSHDLLVIFVLGFAQECSALSMCAESNTEYRSNIE